MDINTIINVIAIILAVGNFICLYSISRKKAYNEEKGKNIATKEDIKLITKEIESVKDSYNKSLEKHKIELQKDFESYKYMQNLRQSLDNILLKLISECLKAEASKSICYQDNDNSLISANCKISRFLWTYKKRYESNYILLELIRISNKIEENNQLGELKRGEDENGDTINIIPQSDKKNLLDSLEAVLLLFLPPFNTEKPEH